MNYQTPILIWWPFAEKYLGGQRFSYNQFLTFSLSFDGQPASTSEESSGTGDALRRRSGSRYGHDIIIEGSEYRVSLPLYEQVRVVNLLLATRGDLSSQRCQFYSSTHLKEVVIYKTCNK